MSSLSPKTCLFPVKTVQHWLVELSDPFRYRCLGFALRIDCRACSEIADVLEVIATATAEMGPTQMQMQIQIQKKTQTMETFPEATSKYPATI